MSSSKVSFTVRRPTPVSRASSTGASSDGGSSFKVPALPRHLTSESVPGSPLGRNGDGKGSRGGSPKVKARTYGERDSSDEDEGIEDELVTGFDQFGPKPTGPLVIPALQNKDWRELARKRKTAGLYVPPSGAAVTGADGSVGGLGTRDAINSGPQLSGLQPVSNKRIKTEEDVEMDEETSTPPPAEPLKVGPKEEETEDQKALRLLLAGDDPSEGQTIDIIPPPSEDDAYKQDVAELPDSADLDAYERVPVSQFGAALLRGMGWKEGEAATRRVGKNGEKKGMVEPWLPTARPALLGIGAKEKEVFDDGSKTGKKGSGTKRRGKPDTKYMPLLKVEKSSRQGSGDRDSRSGSSSSRRRSPEAEERRSSRRSSVEPDRRRDRDYDRDRYGETRRDSERDGHREDRYRERDRDDKDMDKDRDRDRRRERDYGSSSRRDNDRDEDKRRERERSPDRSRRRDKDRKD